MKIERTALHDKLLGIVLEDQHGWCQDVLRRFGREGFLESGSVSCDKSLNVLIKHRLVYRVTHIDPDVNTPDYGITELGRHVFEMLMIVKREKEAVKAASERTERLNGWIG